MTEKAPGEIITFYSYKGGTGRSMALANVAWLMAERKKRVLMIDWDLEAPGLHRFFRDRFERRFPLEDSRDYDINQYPGLLNLFVKLEELVQKRDWGKEPNRDITNQLFKEASLSSFILQTDNPRLDLLKAGTFDEQYARLMNNFHWDALFSSYPWLIPAFGQYLANDYDYVLIDSRTGLTDTSSICTAVLPDKLVTVFIPNRQNIIGVLEIITRATQYRKGTGQLRPLVVFPLASRIELSERDKQRDWRKGNPKQGLTGYQELFEKRFLEIYPLEDNVPETNFLDDYFNEVFIHYLPGFAYGEELAVVTERSRDRQSLTRAYTSFAERLTLLRAPWEAFTSDQIDSRISAFSSDQENDAVSGGTRQPVFLSRSYMETLYQIFNRFVAQDQRNYYKHFVSVNRKAAGQVNLLRALVAFTTGLTAASGGLMIATNPSNGLGIVFLVLAACIPASGALFNLLSDLYQWERLTEFYEAALENIEIGDAQSPMEDMDDLTYRASLSAFFESVFDVMQDEAGQWGPLIRSPRQLQDFIRDEKVKAARSEYESPPTSSSSAG